MRVTSHRLRSNIIKKKTVAEEDAFLKAKSERSRRHRYLLLLVGLAGSLNLNTTLLTPIIFNCENFSSKCSIAYYIGRTIAYALSTFFISYQPSHLSIIAFAIATLHLLHGIIALLLNGNLAKLLFILLYFCNGFIVPILSQASKFNINLLSISHAKIHFHFN